MIQRLWKRKEKQDKARVKGGFELWVKVSALLPLVTRNEAAS